jgi:lipoprotein-anchoring transpeptidase ErfK/SrfK
MKTTAIKLASTAALAAMLMIQQTAQAVELEQTVSLKEAAQGQLDPELPVVVVVNQEEHKTHVLQLQNEQLLDVFAIPNAVGNPSTPTPNCRARITQKELNPSWKPPRSIDPNQHVVPPFVKTHKNPLGLANLRLSVDHGMIALHGTNDPKHIGQSVSHGCIRHLNKDIVALYKIVHLGTPVYIVQNTDEAIIPVTEFDMPNTVAHAKTANDLAN